MEIFWMVLLGLALVLLYSGYLFYRIGFYPKVIPAAETLKMELEKERLLNYPEIQTWECEEIHISSPHGYELFGYFYPVPGSKKTLILSHGITYSLYGSLKYIPFFRKHGFNALVYDNRFHSQSGGSGCSFGFFEKDDLKALVDWVYARFGPAALVGTHGESLGAAITLQHAAIDPRIAFAIADCPFSDLDRLFRIRLRGDFHLPAFPLLHLSRGYASLLLGFDYHEASPIRQIAAIHTPILFIHGEKDGYIPPSMSQDLYRQKTQGIKQLYLAKEAKHAQSIVVDRQEYQRQVDLFLIASGCVPADSLPETPV